MFSGKSTSHFLQIKNYFKVTLRSFILDDEKYNIIEIGINHEILTSIAFFSTILKDMSLRRLSFKMVRNITLIR